MANIIHNPDNVPQGVTTGYQRQNTVLFAGNTGFMNINISPNGFITSGTVFEMNGVLFRVESDEVILDFLNQGNNRMFFVYAVPITDEIVNFQASLEIPQWDNLKGGWYNENLGRALIRVFTSESGAIWAMAQMTGILYSSTPPNTGGVSVYFKNVKINEIIELPTGWYRYDLVSGLGEGNATNATSTVNAAGGVPLKFKRLRGVFFHNGGEIIVNVGGNGFRGGNGTVSSGDSTVRAGAGGSGAGEESYITLNGFDKITTGHIKPGNGSMATTGNSARGEGILATLPHTSMGQNIFIIIGDGVSTRVPNINGTGAPNANDTFIRAGKSIGSGFGGGGAFSIPVSFDPNAGGGGAPGWGRQEGDPAAGYVEIFSLLQ